MEMAGLNEEEEGGREGGEEEDEGKEGGERR
jgi:hypothetical protein